MSRFEKKIHNPFNGIDWWIVIIYLLLLAWGWISICGASFDYGHFDLFSLDDRPGKQLLWIACSIGLAFVLLMIEEKFYNGIAYFAYAFMLLLLFITPFIAKDIKGSLSWIQLGPLSLQPAEFAKCATALGIAKFMSSFNFSLEKRSNFLKVILFVCTPMFLIVLQHETGSALVYLAFFLMFYREGMTGSILFSGIALVIYFVIGIRYSDVMLANTTTSVGEFSVLLMIWIFTWGMIKVNTTPRTKTTQLFIYTLIINIIAFIVSEFIYSFEISWVQLSSLIVIICYLSYTAFYKRISNYFFIAIFTLGSLTFFYSSDYVLNNVLQPHQQTRVKVLLGIEQDLRGAGYNVHQSKIAIGSGGLEGKGFLNGTQTKLKYVPEQDTDFIFCTVGEEEGFLGSTFVLLLFLFLILRLIYLSEQQRTTFGRIYGYSVMSILLFHVFINIGMVLGLTPVIGIPLPFFSYGGSSLWGFTILLFIFLRINAENKNKIAY